MEDELCVDNVEQKEFKFPLNIKQMGTVDQKLKVYMEDYVYTYLYQYARSENHGEKLAVLVGEHFVKDGADITLISGAIEAKNAETYGGKVSFSEESWNNINRQVEMYFKELCIVGWVHIQPDFGTYLMPSEEAFHKECFKENWQVLFNMDPSERTDAFYALENPLEIRQLRGYFIYYDKNENMQDYMIDNSMGKHKLPEYSQEERRTFGQSAAKFFGFGKDKEEEDKPNDRIDAADKIRKVLNRKEDIKMREQRRRQLVLTAFCAVIFAGTVGIFGNIVSSNYRLKSIESQMVSIQEEYYAQMSKIIEGATTEATAKVFAQQNEENVETQNAETQKQEDENISTAQTVPKEETSEYVPVAVSPDFLADTRYNVYWVEEGDNLWAISTKFYGTSDKVDIIMAVNGLSDENLIYYGEKLMIPRDPF